MLDKDGYPDDASLKAIKEWDVLKQGLVGLLELIKENTNWADRQIRITGEKVINFEYHTGGWSGNEEVIHALQDNLCFFAFFWLKSTRGGHYYFKIEHPEWYGEARCKERAMTPFPSTTPPPG